MKLAIEISDLPDPGARVFEIVERKGLGHPDTLCDALAENFSVALSRFYLDRFGFILHHNVDKILLVGGEARPQFGGGKVTSPIEIFFAGRATRRYKGVEVPIEAIAIESCRQLLRRTFHALDPERHVNVHCLVRPGSEELVELFERRQRSGVWLANDSSIGAGFAPLSPIERDVLAIDHILASAETRAEYPVFGEDIKVLATRSRGATSITVACAFCDQHVSNLDDYLVKKGRLQSLVTEICTGAGEIRVNAADDPGNGSIYLTVTGTSAEAGDDGEVGRGNRANGLITPCRPMTMEAVAGKNPVSHVGKLYNLAARDIAEAIIRDVPEIAAAECYLVSRIGQPVAEPEFAHLRIAPRGGGSAADFSSRIEPILRQQLSSLDTLWRRLLDQSCSIF